MSICRHNSCVLSVLCVLSVVFVCLMRLMVACFYVLMVSPGMKGCVEFSGSSHSAVLFPSISGLAQSAPPQRFLPG